MSEIGSGIVSVALCSGRHEMPDCVKGSIFGKIPPGEVTRVMGLENHAIGWLSERRIVHLNLYVTGLTVALIAALNACKECRIGVTLYHFNRETGEYFPQEVC